ncbi:MAG: hypothetical protein C3F02_02075 [Parcubacteria group bacterium]|nr:MAG: hypothetical protein C3F02_02075 [Parcubacteria group bacterium]
METATTTTTDNNYTPGPNQRQVFGKSELLDAGAILRDVLLVGPRHVVGDLGAGGGMFCISAARIVGPQGQVYAVDVMKHVLGDIESKARMTGLDNIKTVWSNLEMVGATKIKENMLDFALLINVLFQSKKHEEILTEAARLLKVGGKLLVIDWSDTRPGFAPNSDRQVDPKKIIETAARFSLDLVREFKAGHYHFGLIFNKTA